MSEFSVMITELQKKAEMLSERNRQYLKQVEGLQETEASLHGMWEGESRDAFHGSFSRDMQQMMIFYRTVTEYVRSLFEIVQKYQMAEKRNLEIIGG